MTANSFKLADKYAFEYAKEDFGESEVMNYVQYRYTYIDTYSEYTRGDGYDSFVYAVIKIPDPVMS